MNIDINSSHVKNIIMLHVDIIYLACRGRKYVTSHHSFRILMPLDKSPSLYHCAF